ncbi:mannose-1-phosphate guanylyltransferase/mannose-6-phosphate isomerase [Caenimonas sedimenti]|uniref:mannose-1-phosphate guanylyltransferase n=1 Tax=Caenimonas sedimenti TaxID=2596921 RepID=A0A562ZVH0_9BURK|nr:mannose-1-phosphate guanylyltransferase/mannose-6-phosphate isomerase [Caenimonas sedimenti]TWO72305.1 mannose-1-phosphate guanylyltransferase/mannose-6-phosphate isomerase [Caenimonas sedimenti]
MSLLPPLPFHPVVLSGGTGSRLWPLSRMAYPKQLLALAGEPTMLQATLARASGLTSAKAPLLVCNSEHRFLIRDQWAALGVDPMAAYLEPVGRNTAPAIALAALHLAASDPQALMLILPADHVIDDVSAFGAAVARALRAAQAGYLVTFGISPSSPETGYGYIQVGGPLGEEEGVNAVASFVEKPDAARAAQYLAQGNYVWNSGIFVFQAGRYLEELGAHRPDILAAVRKAWDARTEDLGFVRPGKAEFEACPSESIDYAVMQSSRKAAVVPASFGWSDVGSWDALWEIGKKDAQGNVTQGDIHLHDTRNSYVRSQGRMVAVVGMDDVVVVETADAVLVMPRSKAQDVKHIVAKLQKEGRREHLEHLRVHRPWGWYEGVDQGERFQVKRIMVQPGARLSLQMHHHRAEHWIVVSGTAKVTINGDEQLLTENQSTYIPLGRTHRLENPGRLPLHLIEVQSGSYLGEDDIVRFQDDYKRD